MTNIYQAKFEEASVEAKDLGSAKALGSLVSNFEDEVKAEWKKASQLLTKSWLPEGKDIQKKLIELSMDRTENPKDISDQIVALFKENKVDLTKIFPTPDTLFEIDWDSFFSTFRENPRNVQVTIPYPPRPMREIVTDRDLRAWLNNTDPDQYYPSTPYIPYSCL